MLYPLPSNVIPSLLIGLSGVFFGVRGLLHYRKVRAPLTLYYSLAGLFVGVASLFYSVPFVFTQSDLSLKVLTLTGDLFYYATAVVSGRIIWYIGFKKKISFGWVLIPTLLLCIATMVVFIQSLQNVEYRVVNGLADYPIPPIPSLFFATVTLLFILVGYLTVKEAKGLEIRRQRYRLYSIGLAFSIGGIFAIYNYLFHQGNNSSLISIVGYIVAALTLFLGVLFVSRRKLR